MNLLKFNNKSDKWPPLIRNKLNVFLELETVLD